MIIIITFFDLIPLSNYRTKKILEHKRICMAAGAGAMSFHPNYDSTREYIDNNNYTFREKKTNPIITHIEKEY